MAKQTSTGFLNSFSIPTVSRQSALDDKRKGLLGGVASTYGGAGVLGALLGGAIAPQQLNEQEEQRFAIKDAADASFKAQQGTAAYDAMSPNQHGLLYQKEVAKATANVDPALAAEMYSQIAAEEAASSKAALEQQKLVADVLQKQAARASSISSTSLSEASQWAPYAVPKANGNGWDLDSQVLLRTVKGQRVDPEGNIVTSPVMKYDDAVEREAAVSEAAAEAKGGTLYEREIDFRSISKPEITTAKNLMRGASSSSRVINRVTSNMISTVENTDIDPNQYLGLAGKTSAFVNDILNAFDGGRKTLMKTFTYDSEGNEVASLTDHLEEGSDARQLAEIGVLDAQTQSNIIELAFAVAKIHEPGGRLSDNDFKLALKRIGGVYNDPKALAAALQEISTGSLSDYTNMVESIETDATSFGIPKGRGTEIVFGAGHDRLMESYAQTEENFNKLAALFNAPTEEEKVLKARGLAGTTDATRRIFGGQIPEDLVPSPQVPRDGAGEGYTVSPDNVLIYPNGGSIDFNIPQ